MQRSTAAIPIRTSNLRETTPAAAKRVTNASAQSSMGPVAVSHAPAATLRLRVARPSKQKPGRP
jgi:hypothetical protein